MKKHEEKEEVARREMIELNGQIQNIMRSTERQPVADSKRTAASKVPKDGDETRVASSTPPPVASEKPDAQHVINFEYVPSGRLNLNQEEQKRLIDFFE